VFTSYSFYISDNAEPTPAELEFIVELGGGNVFKKKPGRAESKEKNLICVIGKGDFNLFKVLSKNKLKIVDGEFILNSALTSCIEINESSCISDESYFEKA